MPGNVHEITPQDIAKWPAPDYEHGVRREWLPAFSMVLLVITTILVCIRLWLRARKQGGGLGWDDALLVPSWLMLVGFTSCTIDACDRGTIDRHMWDMQFYKYENYALNAWIGQFIFSIGTPFIKVSILLFHRRMVKGTFARRWRWAVWLAISFIVLYTAILVAMLVANCNPTESYWKYLNPSYTKKWHCLDTKWVNYFAGICSVVTDFYSLCLPWAMIWPLQMPRKQKIMLNAVFALGLVVVVAAGFRTNSLVRLGHITDLTWNGFNLYMWSEVEWNLGIMCACAPSLRVLFGKFVNSSIYRGWSSNSSRSKNCGAAEPKYWEDREAHPARVIQLRRTLTVESSSPIIKSDKEKHFVSQTESEATATSGDDRTTSSASSRRQGVSQVPRAYRVALRQDLSESQETLQQISNGESREPSSEQQLREPSYERQLSPGHRRADSATLV